VDAAASVDCGVQNAEEQKADVTADDSCIASSMHDNVTDSVNGNNDSNVDTIDTREHASPECHPEVSRMNCVAVCTVSQADNSEISYTVPGGWALDRVHLMPAIRSPFCTL